ncbi:hypothetical protein [Natronorubrum tibetense]|nr:hypothetical protein [Natronorubrum tibetense]
MLRDALAPVVALVNEVIVYADGDALVLHALGTDKTASVTVTIPSEACTAYTPSEQSFGINVDRLTEFLHCFSSTAPVTITSPPHSDRFTISIVDSTYCADCIDPNTIYQRTQNDSTQPVAAVFTVPSESTPLKQSLVAANLCSETITIETQRSDPVVQFTATGDTDSMTSQLTRDDILTLTGTSIRATYPVDKFLSMHKALNRRTDQFRFTINATQTLSLTALYADNATTTWYTLSPHATTSTD